MIYTLCYNRESTSPRRRKNARGAGGVQRLQEGQESGLGCPGSRGRTAGNFWDGESGVV